MKNNTNNLTREAYKKRTQHSREQDSEHNFEYRKSGLKRKLNWIIFLLIIGIIVDYLILFFFNP